MRLLKNTEHEELKRHISDKMGSTTLCGRALEELTPVPFKNLITGEVDYDINPSIMFNEFGKLKKENRCEICVGILSQEVDHFYTH